MAQHDYDVANGTGLAVRTDINNVLGAIATQNSGATAPATMFANMFWYDTTTSTLKKRDNTNTDWIPVATFDDTGNVATWAGGIDIVGLTALTAPAADDLFGVYDTSATANRKITFENYIKVIAALTALTAPAVDDTLAIYDLSATAPRSISLADVLKVTSVLTALTAPAVDDVLAIYDLSETAMRGITTVDLLEVLNVLTEDTTPDGAADFALVYDTSAGTVKKVKPNNLSGGGGATTIASGSLTGTSVSLTNIPNTYSYLVLYISGVSTTNGGGASVRVRVDTNNGASYDTTAANYKGHWWDASGTVLAAMSQASIGHMGVLNSAAATMSAVVFLYGYQTGLQKKYLSRALISDVALEAETNGTYVGSTDAIDAIEISLSSGSFDGSSAYLLVGVK